MSTVDDISSNMVPYLTFYCNFMNNDKTIFDSLLNGMLAFDYNSLLQVMSMSDWKITAYPAPTISTLLSYNKDTVLAWYKDFYEIPDLIKTKQPFFITPAIMSKIRVDASMKGFSVYDVSTQTTKVCDGKSWVENSTQTATKAILDIGTKNTVTLLFQANVGRMVDIPGFGADLNLGAEFTFDPLTGKGTYIGDSAKQIVFHVSYTMTKNVPNSTQSVFTWLAKNGSTVQPNRVYKEDFTATGLLQAAAPSDPKTITRPLNLDKNDTFQLAAQYTTTGNVKFSHVGVVAFKL